MRISGNIPMDELAPGVEVSLSPDAKLTDAEGNVIGEIISAESDDTGLTVDASLAAGAADRLLYARVATEQRRLAAARVDDLIIAGAPNAASILDNPNLLERTSMEAVARVLQGDLGNSWGKPSGPARRKPPTVSKRKAAKTARKRNR